MYVKRVGNDIILLVIYVDDIIITSIEESAIKQIESNMNKTFDMTGLGLLHYCLGVEVWRIGSFIFVSQTKYAMTLLDRFIMTDCKISSTLVVKGIKFLAKTISKSINESVYRKLVGSLIYLTITRPDLSFVMRFISIFMTSPKVEHWNAAKQVLRYVKGVRK
jgi:hypothetical protein